MSHETDESQEYTPFVMSCSGELSSGDTLTFNLKGTRYANSKVTFEVRFLLSAFFEKTTKWQTHKVIKQQLGGVELRIEKYGEDFWDEFLPSRRALEEWKNREEAVEWHLE